MAIASKPSRRRFPNNAAAVQSFVLERTRVPGCFLGAASLVQNLRKLLTNRSFDLCLLVGLVYLFTTPVDIAIPFSTPYYFLVCLPATVLLFDALFYQAIEGWLGIWPAILVTGSVVMCQLILSQQRQALP
jgi:hypothetical protein